MSLTSHQMTVYDLLYHTKSSNELYISTEGTFTMQIARTQPLAIPFEVMQAISTHPFAEELDYVNGNVCIASVSIPPGEWNRGTAAERGHYPACAKCPYQLQCGTGTSYITATMKITTLEDDRKRVAFTEVEKEKSKRGPQVQEVPPWMRPGRPGVWSEKAQAHRLLGLPGQKGGRTRKAHGR